MRRLGKLLRDQSRFEEAESVFRQVLCAREQGFGKLHWDTLHSMQDLAEVLENQKKHSESRELCEEAIEGLQKLCGNDHEDTISAYFRFSKILRI